MPLDLEKLRQPTLEERFEQTQDLHFAIMAIGAEPDSPPAWAIHACRLYYFQQAVSVEAPAAGRPPRYSLEDGVLLEDVAALIVERDLSVTAAVKQVTGEGSDGTDFRRLMRIWKRSLHPEFFAAEGSKRAMTNKWLDRARDRAHKRLLTETWNEAKAEIESGNLSLEIDPKVEERRLKQARWFKFPADLNRDSPGAAPPSAARATFHEKAARCQCEGTGGSALSVCWADEVWGYVRCKEGTKTRKNIQAWKLRIGHDNFASGSVFGASSKAKEIEVDRDRQRRLPAGGRAGRVAPAAPRDGSA